jgi:GNAT superfamily N-acetyltransferase
LRPDPIGAGLASTAAADATAPAARDAAFLTAASAANLAGWHDLHVRSLGFSAEWRDGLWLTPDEVPAIFFHAIAVRPGASAGVIGERVARQGWSSVSDPWSDLAMPAQGFSLDGDHAWMVREPVPNGTAPARSQWAMPDGLVIEQVRDADALADFERAAALGFGSPPRTPFTWHAPALLLDPRLQIWRGQVDGHTVAVAMGFADAGVLGVYGVTTMPDARRRGYATAVTRWTIDAAPVLPAVLQPSAMAEALYARLGFRRFTTFRAWDRRPPTD